MFCKYHHSSKKIIYQLYIQVTRCPHYTFCKINYDQTKIVHSRLKIRNLQYVNKDLFGMCATSLRLAYY